eukprot:17003_1
MSFLLFAVVIGINHASDLHQELVTGSNAFGFALTDELSTDSSINVWISPFCITSCFALVYPGSNGNTQTEIADVFGYPTSTVVAPSAVTQSILALQTSIQSTYNGVTSGRNKPSVVSIANKIYSSSDLQLKQPYIDALSYGNDTFIEYDFDFTSNNAKPIINAWISDATNGLIDSIIDESIRISDWKYVALNAIYLKGTFEKQFNEDKTSDSIFYSDESRQNQVTNIHLMHQIDNFEYYNNGNYQFLKFNFDDDPIDQVSSGETRGRGRSKTKPLFVLFVLPINNDLYSQNNALLTDYDVIDNALTNLQHTRIALALPRLSMEATYELNEDLQALGILDAFNPSTADFSEMSDTQVFIDKVLHKTMIEMDEKGLVAAAVTAIGMVGTSVQMHPDPILFKADHPFQMFIIDGEHDNTILFMGQVNNPGMIEGRETPTYDESGSDVWIDYASYRSDEPTSTEIEDTSDANTESTASNTDEFQGTGPHNEAFMMGWHAAGFVVIMHLL